MHMTYPSEMTQWSRITQPTIFTILPITQCLPITDFLILVRSSTLVVCPTIESVEICAFGSIIARLSGSVGKVQFVWARNCCAYRKSIHISLDQPGRTYVSIEFEVRMQSIGAGSVPIF